MTTPTLYLDFIIIASATYPAGFSNSLFNVWRGAPGRVSTEFLLILALPYPAIVLAAWIVRPELLVWHGTTAALILLALIVVPIGLLIEYGITWLASRAANHRFARGITLQGFWSGKLSAKDHLLLVAVAVGEELVYRGIWVSVLLSWGVSTSAVVGISSLAYGVNHLAFGRTVVISKTVTGILYCTLFLVGGRCIWLPIISHTLQNILLFVVARKRHA